LSYCSKCGEKIKEDDKFCNVCAALATRTIKEEFFVFADNLIARVKEFLHEGNITRIIVNDDKGKVLLEIRATVGVIGAVIASGSRP
jgi:hypothetical protein